MKVLIVGAGIAGLSSALFLRKNHDVTIVERSSKIENFGYFLALWPNAWKVLDALDIKKELWKKSAHIPYFSFFDSKGNLVYKADLDLLHAEGKQVREVDRHLLHETLAKKLGKKNITFNVHPTSLKQHNGGVDVTFSDGSMDTFDYVVGADGIHSYIRNFTISKIREYYTGHCFWICWVRNLKYKPKGIEQAFARNKYIGLYPNHDKKKLGVFIMLPYHHLKDIPKEEQRDFIVNHYKDMGGFVPEVLERLPKNPDLMFHNFDKEIHSSIWRKGRVILIGDAAHATSPIMSMGASMALEDAFYLSQGLDQNFKTRYKRTHILAGISWKLHHILDLPPLTGYIQKNYAKYIFLPRWSKKLQKFSLKF